MLDTIRQLTRTMKLKDLIIANFIPEEFAKSIEKRAAWKEEDDCWIVQVGISEKWQCLRACVFCCWLCWSCLRSYYPLQLEHMRLSPIHLNDD